MSSASDFMRQLGVGDWADEADSLVRQTEKGKVYLPWLGTSVYTGSIYGMTLPSDDYGKELLGMSSIPVDNALFISTIGENPLDLDSVFAHEANKISELAQKLIGEYECIILSPATALTLEGGQGSLADALSYLQGECRSNSQTPPIIILDPDMRDGHSDARAVLPKFCDRMLFQSN